MFYIFSLGAVLSATLMVTNVKPVTAAMNLIMTMFFLAGIYVLLDAHLIAALQIIVYAGAIMVLFLFVILLLLLLLFQQGRTLYATGPKNGVQYAQEAQLTGFCRLYQPLHLNHQDLFLL